PSVELEALVPYTAGKLVSRVHDEGEVLSESHTADGTLLKVRVHAELAAELRKYEPAAAAVERL
ncbi:MAG TPA: GTPase HflX, partial [Streptomyces sp.]|nr:GTPase HflX [Streptomyces sp.]